MKVIPYGRQTIDETDIRAVVKALRSDWLTQGPLVDQFEKALAQYCGSQYAVVVANGTAALHLACLAAGLQKGDEAITSPITFLATANAVIYAGAKPVFADVNSQDVNINPQEIEKKITNKTKVILPVDFGGTPCDIKAISAIAKKNKLVVIEDACHAIGAKVKDGKKWIKVGSCQYSDMTIFSFHPVKTMTTAEGGAITTNNKSLYERLKMLRTHGMCKDEVTAKKGPWYYEMRDLGFNYRMTDLQAALGLSQLKRVDRFIKSRREIVHFYNQSFKDIKNVSLFKENSRVYSAFHLCVLQIDFKKVGKSRMQVVDELKRKGIGTQVHYIPVYHQPYYRKHFKVNDRDFPQAEQYYSQCLSIPLYPTLTKQDLNKIVKTIKDVAR